jgi:hypothetical protein
MKTNPFLHLLVVGFTAIAPLDAAEKQKTPGASSFPFWTAKKRGYVPQFVPGLTATLQLSEAQKAQIAAALDAMSSDEAVKAARGIAKSDPNVTAEQREKARAALDEAGRRLHERVSATLTAEQKALVDKVNAAHAAAIEEAGIVHEAKFATVKADAAARRRIQEEKDQDAEELFLHKLDGILSPSQRDAMTQAADEEAQRNAKAAAAKKPSK